MKCPKCGGDHVDVQREALGGTGTVFGGGAAKPGVFSKNKVNGLGVGVQHFQYQTTALCHDCGYSWHPVGQDEENNKKMAKGCINLIVVIFIVVILVTSCSLKKENAEPVEEPTDKTVTYEATESTGLWSVNVTPLEEFDIELRDGIIYLETYHGKSNQLYIASQYELNGSTYPVSLDELELLGNSLDSVILADGISSVNRVAFNSTNLKRIYLPASLNLIYDDMLAYVYNSLEVVEYGGGEDTWNSVYKHYQAPSAEEALEAEDYEALGSALARKVNEVIGADVDLSTITIHYNVSISDLK